MVWVAPARAAERNRRTCAASATGSAAGRRGIGDGLKLAQHVGTAQLVIRAGVGVIGGPGLVDGGAGERGKDAHCLHRLGAAPGVDHEQGVLAGAGAVHPVQPAVCPEPGLVEPGHVAGGDLAADLLQEPPRRPAARAVSTATVPDDSGMPNSSAQRLRSAR